MHSPIRRLIRDNDEKPECRPRSRMNLAICWVCSFPPVMKVESNEAPQLSTGSFRTLSLPDAFGAIHFRSIHQSVFQFGRPSRQRRSPTVPLGCVWRLVHFVREASRMAGNTDSGGNSIQCIGFLSEHVAVVCDLGMDLVGCLPVHVIPSWKKWRPSCANRSSSLIRQSSSHQPRLKTMIRTSRAPHARMHNSTRNETRGFAS